MAKAIRLPTIRTQVMNSAGHDFYEINHGMAPNMDIAPGYGFPLRKAGPINIPARKSP